MNPKTDTAPTLATNGAGRHRDGDGFTRSYRTAAGTPEGGDGRYMRAWLDRWHSEPRPFFGETFCDIERPRVRFVWGDRDGRAER